MIFNDFHMQASEGKQIYVASWSPEREAKTKAVVQLAHGMAEHISRYARFASYLCDNGYIVYGNDHRGHGKTAGTIENVGFLGEVNGFEFVVEDMVYLSDRIQQNHPDLPIFLLGHSMGSLLVRYYISKQGNRLKGAVLSGTMGHPGILGRVALLIAQLEILFKGKRAKSPRLNQLSFGSANDAFKPARTDFDWLSRDAVEVDKYVEDPYCGAVFSAGFFRDLLSGLYKTFSTETLEQTPEDLPLLLFSGEQDPVGGRRGVTKVYQSYLEAGVKDINLKLYPGGRHEMLNEINRQEVFDDVVTWLDKHLNA